MDDDLGVTDLGVARLKYSTPPIGVVALDGLDLGFGGI